MMVITLGTLDRVLSKEILGIFLGKIWLHDCLSHEEPGSSRIMDGCVGHGQCPPG